MTRSSHALSINDPRSSPTSTRGLAYTNNLRSYPLAERDSLLRRDRATRSCVCLRLRSHSIQPGLCNATCQTLQLITGRVPQPRLMNKLAFRCCNLRCVSNVCSANDAFGEHRDTKAADWNKPLALCQTFGVLARGTAYDRIGTWSDKHEANHRRIHYTGITVAADK